MRQKLLSVLVALTLITAMLTGCGGSKTTGETSNTPTGETDTGKEEASVEQTVAQEGAGTDEKFENPVTISCMVWSYADRTASTDKWIKECEEKFNIIIDLQNIPTDNYSTVLKTKISAGDMPDIVSVHEITKGFEAESMKIDENTFADLSGLENVANFSQEVRDNVSINGKLYYVPISQNALGVLYNKKVFEDNGIAIPTNINEFTAAMDKLKTAGVAPLAGSFGEAWSAQIIPFLAFDNYVLGQDPDIPKKLYDSSTNVSEMRWSALGDNVNKALGLGKEWIDAGYFTDNPIGTDASVACQLLATGKAAMFITGNWEYSVAAAATEEGTSIGFFPLPLNQPGDEIRISTAANEGMCINANSKNLEAAKIALDYYFSTEVQTAIMKDFGGVSTNATVTSEDPFVQEMSEALNNNTLVPGGFFGGSDYLFPKSSSFNKEVECQSLMAGLITPEQFCEKMDQAIAEVAEIK